MIEQHEYEKVHGKNLEVY